MHHGLSLGRDVPTVAATQMRPAMSLSKLFRTSSVRSSASTGKSSKPRLSTLTEDGLGNAAATVMRLRSASASLLNNIGESGESWATSGFAQVGDRHFQGQGVDLKTTNVFTARERHQRFFQVRSTRLARLVYMVQVNRVESRILCSVSVV